MRVVRHFAAVFIWGFVLIAFADEGPEALVRTKHIGQESVFGGARAVLVNDVALFHTSQFLPLNLNVDSELIGKNPIEQARVILSNLGGTLNSLDSRPESRIVKLNVYVPSQSVADEIRPFLATQFSDAEKPAISLVQTKLRRPELLVTMDAVAIAHRPDQMKLKEVLQYGGAANQVSILPRGPRLYVSGQAEKGMSLADATTKTMQSLQKTLRNFECDLKDIAQVKCFLTPMAEVEKVEAALVQFFAPQPTPPCVFVEWQSTLPIEIELVAAARPKPGSQPPLEFITPPGMTASPVFCRVVRINDPRTIFISGLFSREAGDGAAQVNDVFAQLQEVLKANSSDLRHLAKATYYVSDNDASNKLGELRPKYYDPQRPPAASKAQVAGVGMTGRSLTLDMIAVPAK